MGFHNVNEGEFHGFGNLVIWFEKVLESYENISKGVLTNTAHFKMLSV